MILSYKKIGNENNTPIVVLHGLLGNSDNWLIFSKPLAENFLIILPDLRNHGNSFHSNIFTFDTLVEDLEILYKHLNINNSVLMGHSLGGLIALKFAEKNSEIVKKLIIIDIVPKNFDLINSDEAQIFKTIFYLFNQIKLDNFKTFDQVYKFLEDNNIPTNIQSVIIKNLKIVNGHFEWKLNYKVIYDNLTELFKTIKIDLSKIKIPILLLYGENSKFVSDNEAENFQKQAFNANVVKVPNASHWLHVENPEFSLKEMKNFVL